MATPCLSVREFLKEALDAKSARRRHTSLRSVAKASGFPSPSGLSMVLNGKRKLTLIAAEKVAHGLALTSREKRILYALVRLELAPEGEAKALAQERLLRAQGGHPEAELELRQHRFLATWYAPVLYMLLGNLAHSQEPIALARKIGRGVTPGKVTAALNNLLELGLIKRAQDGRFTHTHAALTTRDDLKSRAVHRYHAQMLERARDALALPQSEREFSGLTVSVSDAQLRLLKEKIRAFRSELNAWLSASDEPGEIHQLSIHLFPLTSKETS